MAQGVIGAQSSHSMMSFERSLSLPRLQSSSFFDIILASVLINLSKNVTGQESHCIDSTKGGLWPLLQQPRLSQDMSPTCTANSRTWRLQLRCSKSSSVTSIFALCDSLTTSSDFEVDDEHTRTALASPLYTQEREANASLFQAYHSNEEGLLPAAPSILAGTGKPVAASS